MKSFANFSASPASHTFDRQNQRKRAKLEQECPSAPLKAGHKGFVAEPGLILPAEDPVTPRDPNNLEPVCPGAPLRKGHKGFVAEPDDGF